MANRLTKREPRIIIRIMKFNLQYFELPLLQRPLLLVVVTFLLMITTAPPYNNYCPGMASAATTMNMEENFIVGGSKAEPNQYPFFVQMLRHSPKEDYLCAGASLVAPDILLTAAHCYIKRPNHIKIKKVLVGATKSNDASSSNGQYRKVLHIRPHPSYKEWVNEKNDIMLLKIQKVTKPNLKPIALNFNKTIPNNANNNDQELLLRAIGYGLTRSGLDPKWKDYIPNDLMQVNMTLVDNQKCANDYQTLINKCVEVDKLPRWFCENGWKIYANIMVCAIGEEKGTCGGDSGSPLIDYSIPDQPPQQVGIVSYGRADCNMKEFFNQVDGPDDYFPRVFTRVSGYAKWLTRNICELTDTKLAMCSSLVKNGKSCKKKGAQCLIKYNKKSKKRIDNCCGKNLKCTKLKRSNPYPRCVTCSKVNKPCGGSNSGRGRSQQPPCCNGLKCKKLTVRRKGKAVTVMKCAR